MRMTQRGFLHLNEHRRDTDFPHARSGKRGGRKAGSVNKPKVAVKMADGSTRMMSEAIAARESKKQAKISGSPNPAASPGPAASISKSPAVNGRSMKDKAQTGPASSALNNFTASASFAAGDGPRESTPSANSDHPGMFTGGATPSGIGSQMVPIDLADDDDDDAAGAAATITKRNQPVISFDPSPAGRNKVSFDRWP